MPNKDAARSAPMLRALYPKLVARTALHASALGILLLIVAWTAVLTKRAHTAMPLIHVRTVATENFSEPLVVTPEDPWELSQPESIAAADAPTSDNPFATDPTVRWFDGRPIRPARTMLMTVTAYSPDARSCDDSADGLTATLHSVQTNGWKLVAADKGILPMGSMLTIPGYDHGLVVPVLDVGGKIKGNRLDVLFPTHEQAKAWGVRRLRVTLWQYADGKPAGNPRRLR